MLVKFDKIKYLEDFFNLSKARDQPDAVAKDPIKLYEEIDEDQLNELVEKRFIKIAAKRQLTLKNKHWALQGLVSIVQRLLKKRPSLDLTKFKLYFMFWRLKVK